MTVEMVLTALNSEVRSKKVVISIRLNNGTTVKGEVVGLGGFHDSEVTVYGESEL